MRLLPKVIVFVVAVPTVFACVVYVGLFVHAMLRNPTYKHLTDLLLLWQTQTGAAFALAAAIIGVAVVLDQTASTKQMEQDRRARRAAGLRATFPITLDAISDYAKRCGEISSGLLDRSNSTPIIDPTLQFPHFPEDTISKLGELIEEIEAEHARPIIILSKRLQIHNARTRDTIWRAKGDPGIILSEPSVVERVVDAAEICARCEALFRYARSETVAPAPPISADDVKKSLRRILPGNDARLDELQNEVDRMAGANTDSHRWLEC